MASDKDKKAPEEDDDDLEDEESEDEESEDEDGADDASDEEGGDDDDDDDESDEDDGDDDDDDDDEEEKETAKPAPVAKTTPSAKKPDEDDDDDDDDDDEDDDDEEDDDEEEASKAAAKPAAKASPSASKAKDDDDEDEDEDDDDEAPAPAAAAAPGGSLGKPLILFILVVGGLAAGFWYLGGTEGAGSRNAPKWSVGDTVDVNITLVPSDALDLACASADVIEGRHCGFEDKTKRWQKEGTEADDAHTFRPYTTVDGIEFAAAGVWSQPALAKDKLPKNNERFSVKCKYKVDGKLKAPGIRWKSTGGWIDSGYDWYAGAVSDCQLSGQ